MANGTIDTGLVELFDLFPGPVFRIQEQPPDGFMGASHHNVATPLYPLGTKFAVYNDGRNSKGKTGWGTMVYARLYTQDATNVLAARHIVAYDDGAAPCSLTNEVATDLAAYNGPIAVALGAMTSLYYGWFWCGQVAPSDLIVSGSTYVLDGNLYTVTSGVVAGTFTHADLDTAGTAAGEIGLTVVHAFTDTINGWAYSADA